MKEIWEEETKDINQNKKEKKAALSYKSDYKESLPWY